MAPTSTGVLIIKGLGEGRQTRIGALAAVFEVGGVTCCTNYYLIRPAGIKAPATILFRPVFHKDVLFSTYRCANYIGANLENYQ